MSSGWRLAGQVMPCHRQALTGRCRAWTQVPHLEQASRERPRLPATMSLVSRSELRQLVSEGFSGQVDCSGLSAVGRIRVQWGGRPGERKRV